MHYTNLNKIFLFEHLSILPFMPNCHTVFAYVEVNTVIENSKDYRFLKNKITFYRTIWAFSFNWEK